MVRLILCGFSTNYGYSAAHFTSRCLYACPSDSLRLFDKLNSAAQTRPPPGSHPDRAEVDDSVCAGLRPAGLGAVGKVTTTRRMGTGKPFIMRVTRW